MPRPYGVTAIGCFCLLAGVYLCSVSAIMLLVPGATPTLRAAPFVRAFVRAFGLVNPYLTIAIGMGWALVAWGLFQLRDWARLAAQVLLGIGVGWAIQMLLTSRIHSPWRVLAVCVEIILRIAAVGYLFTPAVLDAFLTMRSERFSSTSSGPGP